MRSYIAGERAPTRKFYPRPTARAQSDFSRNSGEAQREVEGSGVFCEAASSRRRLSVISYWTYSGVSGFMVLMRSERLSAAVRQFSVPRICPADDIDPASFENAVPDDLFLKIVALIRMAVPYTGMIMSTREGQRIRTEALKLGISQISGGSRTSVGGYAIRSVQEMEEKTEQFETNDRRSLDEIVRWLLENHYLPSFCTACYRAGRTGDRFMEWAKDGSIATYCQANAIMTMKEYMCDYASKETREAGERVIANELPKIPHEKIRIASEKRLIRIADGERDFRF